MKISDTTKLALIQVYALTNVPTDEEIEEFNNLLDRVTNKEREHYTLLIGD